MASKHKLIVPLKDGRERRYTCASRAAAEKRLCDHNSMVRSLGTSALYLTAYIREPSGREVYITA